MRKITPAKVAHFSGHPDSIYTLEYSMNQSCIYSGGSDGYVVEWDTNAKGDGKLLIRMNKPVYSMVLLGNQLAVGTADGHLHLIDLVANKEVRNIEAHTAGVYDLKQAGEHLLSAGGDGTVKVWETQTFDLLKTVKASDKSARVLAVSRDKQLLAVGFSDCLVRIYETKNYGELATIEGHSNSVFALEWSADGKQLMSSGRDAMLKVWNVEEDFRLLHDIPAHTLQVKCVAVNPSDSLVATCSMDKTIKIWDATDLTLLKVMDKARVDAHSNCINKILWLSDTSFVTCSDDKTVMMWELS